jgi:DNA modification methylase
MRMLQQENSGMDVSQTANEHDVQENIQLLREFVPLAFRCLKDKGFLVMFCDEMNFRWLHDLGVAAGFAVQRWSAVWCKAQAMNQAAGYNFTKATENAIIMRKKGSVLATHQALNWKMITKTAEDKDFDHPFAKPFELWKWMAEAVSQPGQEIWDPFAGSHSGPCAFLKLGRRFQSWERGEQHLYEGLTKVTKVYTDYFAQVKNLRVEAFYQPNQTATNDSQGISTNGGQ